MKVNRIENMKGGWFVGNFEPTAYKTSKFEVSYKVHPKGEKWDFHYHTKVTEIKEEEMVTNNSIIKYVSEWEGKSQTNRTPNGDATIWNDQPLTTRTLVNLIKTIL